MKPDSIGCPLCGRLEVRNFEAIAHDSDVQDKAIAIRECLKCDFAWQWPLARTTEESKIYFESEYQTERKDSYFDKERRIEIAKLQLGFITELSIKPGTLLDIGCGDGTFANEAAKIGWSVTGIDLVIPENPNPTRNGDLHLIGGTTDDLASDRKFMCITLWDVIEHLPDPKRILSEAWEHLLPDGWLIIETGNYQSVDRVLSEHNWWAWQLDHRWYFSPSTLLYLLEPLKFEEAHLAQRVFRPWSREKFDYHSPSKFQTFLSVLKRPLHREVIIREHTAKRNAYSKWPKWAGLEIFTIAIKK